MRLLPPPIVLLDVETRIALIKTLRHAQFVLPLLALIYIWLFLFSVSPFLKHNMSVLFAGCVLPTWSYHSFFYKWCCMIIIGDQHVFLPVQQTITIFAVGTLSEVAHALVFFLMLHNTFGQEQQQQQQQELSNTTLNMLLMIGSALLFVETAAFLSIIYSRLQATTNLLSTGLSLPYGEEHFKPLCRFTTGGHFSQQFFFEEKKNERHNSNSDKAFK